jgi:3-polyprenyl-4-hydroxybenzoate decarboxylase
MITAWSAPQMVRVRASAGPSLRLLAMAVLLFGVVFTHGLHVEGVQGHLVTSAAASAHMVSEEAHGATDTEALARPATMGEPHEGHGPSHPSEHCLSGQPPQGPVVIPPCSAASVSESAAVGRTSVKRGPHEHVLVAAPSVSLRLSVVQQV